jgi:phosphatidate cytidylyltransferase
MTAVPPPLPDPGRWGDLRPRVISGALMAAVGLAGIVAGGVWFQMLAVFVTAVIVWEIWTMIEPRGATRGVLLAALTASVLSGQFVTDGAWGFFLLFFIVPVAGALLLRREGFTFFAFALGLQIASWGLVSYRNDYGFLWLIWLVGVVIVTDLAGYFVGRTIGGPKFWPRVSPKKTWSGILGGWAAAAVLGGIFDLFSQVGARIILISAMLSFASQMGDIAESALKRRMGVKDSSALIPGHGGLFDRFDALLGASLFMLAVVKLCGPPGIAF